MTQKLILSSRLLEHSHVMFSRRSTMIQKDGNNSSRPLLDLPQKNIKRIGMLTRTFVHGVWKWSLEAVPLRLLRAVVELIPGRDVETKDMRFETLIQQAVWISYPFLSNDCERRCCQDFVGCCCPFSWADEGDLEEGSRSGSVGCSADVAFSCFQEDWEKMYKMRFKPDEKQLVTSWLRPDAVDFSSKRTSLGRQGKFDGEGFNRMTTGRLRSLGVEERGNPQRWTPARALSRLKAKGVRSRRNQSLFVWNNDRIPSATHLMHAGVRFRGVATSIASPSLDTVSVWTILSSFCCFLSLLACCFEFSHWSCSSRWQASLELPKVRIYTETKRLLRNLAVYEELALGCESGLWRNYVKTMRCLLETEGDVLLLIRSGVIQSHLAGPLEVVHTWKFMDDGLEAVPLGGPWVKIYHNLNEHLQNRWKNWYARFWISNCSNPILACSFVIFVSLLCLTAFGTYLNFAKAKADGQLMWP
ncbi:hypothetical protein Mapa_013698 [Marchantia paleacea]|nr:hypothetical protein Mapa_013698 [Marchantia paleacea]